ncbi:MAG: ABC transporter permease [Actinomycetota bacterium]|nr:ABC transporter permease [Actinomycetota bacterium]
MTDTVGHTVTPRAGLASSPSPRPAGADSDTDTGDGRDDDATRARVDGPQSIHGSSASSRRLPGWLPPMLLLVALVAFWQVWVSVHHIDAFVLPTPGRIGRAGWQSASLLPHHIWATVVASVAGLVAGAVAGVALAVLIVQIRVVRQVLYPLLVVSQTIPMVVLAPLLIIWFGFGLTPRIVVVALIVFFPVLVSLVTSIDQADPDLLDLVRSMGATRRQVMSVVLVPSAVPAFFAGLRIAAAYTVGGAVIAEFVNPNGGGLGVFITRSRQAYAVDRIFVAVVIVGVLTAALFAAVDMAARLASPWQRPDRSPWSFRRRPLASPAEEHA